MTNLEFKAEVAKQLTLRDWNYIDLGKATGYTQGSLQVMMSDLDKLSDKAIKKIADVLDIDID